LPGGVSAESPSRYGSVTNVRRLARGAWRGERDAGFVSER